MMTSLHVTPMAKPRSHYDDDDTVLEYIQYHIVTKSVKAKKPKLSGHFSSQFLDISDAHINLSRHILNRRLINVIVRRAHFYERGDIVWSCEGIRCRR
jgi:hypothetical protein